MHTHIKGRVIQEKTRHSQKNRRKKRYKIHNLEGGEKMEEIRFRVLLDSPSYQRKKKEQREMS